MELSALLEFEHIAIQCHDDPDADAIAAGFGLHCYFASRGVASTLFYGGGNSVSKPNILRMLEIFGIALEYVPESREWPGLLLTVDCQHGSGNVSPMRAARVAVIDHHIQEKHPPELHDIRPGLGSCATLVWHLLQQAGFDAGRELGEEKACALNTALHYGLYMDTSGLAEVRHPLDRDLRDIQGLNERALRILKNCNLSLDDLSLAAGALQNIDFDPQSGVALVGTTLDDPNLLGFISDLVIQVDNVSVSIVFALSAAGVKYSVRSVHREAKASDVAGWLAAYGLGSGGGHAEKAGGWISYQNLILQYPELGVLEYFQMRMREYGEAYSIIDCRAPIPESFGALYAGRYRKRSLDLAYVPCPESFAGRRQLHIRMLEGDITLNVTPETYLMIGIRGEVYPIARQTFAERYSPLEGAPALDYPYPPVVLDKASGERLSLADFARPCRACAGGGGESAALALPLQNGVKIFTRWDNDNYIKGEPGDWLVWPESDPADLYVVTAALFPWLYEDLAGQTGPRAKAPGVPCPPGNSGSPGSPGSPGASCGPGPGACAGNDAHAVPEPGKEHPGLLDFSGAVLDGSEGGIRVRKKAYRVNVRFAEEPGVAQTREGPVPYLAGDAIITGIDGEIWPVSPKRFAAAYEPEEPAGLKEPEEFRDSRETAKAREPAQPIEAGPEKGHAGGASYRSRPVTALALRVNAPFRVELKKGGILGGKAGDWLMQYEDGSYGIVCSKLFDSLYEPV